MPDFDTRPTEVNIDHYGGDTLTVLIKVDSAIVDGRDWNAQVRASRTSRRVDAVFGVTPDALGAYLILSAEDCKLLAERGNYVGFWDVQLSAAGLDPVTTLAQGTLRIFTDVTRLDP